MLGSSVKQCKGFASEGLGAMKVQTRDPYNRP